MSKKSVSKAKFSLTPGSANPSPPVGPILGQKGVNIMEFCKAFNEKTKDLSKELPVSVMLSVYDDKSFTFSIKGPSVSTLIKKELSLKSGSSTPNTVKVAKLNNDQLIKIAKLKAEDLTAKDVSAAMKTVIGTANSMGVEIESNGVNNE